MADMRMLNTPDSIFEQAHSYMIIICGAYVLRHYREYLPKGADFKPDGPMIREMLSSGSAMAFMYSIVGIGSLFYQGAVNALGDVFIAAQTAGDRFSCC